MRNVADSERKTSFQISNETHLWLREETFKVKLSPNDTKKLGLHLSADGKKRKLYDILGYNEISIKNFNTIHTKSTDHKTNTSLQNEIQPKVPKLCVSFTERTCNFFAENGFD